MSTPPINPNSNSIINLTIEPASPKDTAFNPNKPFIFDPQGHISPTTESQKPIKRNITRCSFESCNKVLGLSQKTTNICRCKQLFCSKHFPHFVHKCSIDYVGEAREKTIKEISKKSKKAGEFYQAPASNESY